MSPGKRRRLYPEPSVAHASTWDVDEDAEPAMQAQREAGAALLKHLLSLYALCKLTAKDFAIACHYAASAGVPGADFTMYAVPPDQASDGNYQRQLDKVLPTGGPLDYLLVPSTIRGTGARRQLTVPIVPMYEALDREMLETPDQKMRGRNGVLTTTQTRWCRKQCELARTNLCLLRSIWIR